MTANSLCNASRLWILAAAIFLVQTCVSPSVLPAQNAGEDSDRRAVAIYADAAGYQNNGAHELAIEEWQKLLKQFPRDPLASKAWHYLGVCYIQLDAPKYDKAIGAFSQALKDRRLEVREESMINLSWCLFNEARAADPGSAEQKKGLEEAKTRLTQFLREFGDGSYVDQALFYLGEIEYSLGNPSRSIAYYERLVENRSFAKSSLLPDARYAIAVAYEELGKSTQAQRQYRAFLSNHSDHDWLPKCACGSPICC